jgi:hypothetical protein
MSVSAEYARAYLLKTCAEREREKTEHDALCILIAQTGAKIYNRAILQADNVKTTREESEVRNHCNREPDDLER